MHVMHQNACLCLAHACSFHVTCDCACVTHLHTSSCLVLIHVDSRCSRPRGTRVGSCLQYFNKGRKWVHEVCYVVIHIKKKCNSTNVFITHVIESCTLSTPLPSAALCEQPPPTSVGDNDRRWRSFYGHGGGEKTKVFAVWEVDGASSLGNTI